MKERFTVNVYPARGHAAGFGGDGDHRGFNPGTSMNRWEADRFCPKRSQAVNDILQKLHLEKFIRDVPVIPDKVPEQETGRREAA